MVTPAGPCPGRCKIPEGRKIKKLWRTKEIKAAWESQLARKSIFNSIMGSFTDRG